MIAIPNMEKPQSCDECRILRAEFDGSYDKPITGCRQKMGKKNTLREEWDALILDCPLIEVSDEIWEALKPKVETMSLAEKGWITDDSNTYGEAKELLGMPVL